MNFLGSSSIGTTPIGIKLHTVANLNFKSLKADIVGASLVRLLVLNCKSAKAQFEVSRPSKITSLSCSFVSSAELVSNGNRLINLSSGEKPETTVVNLSALGMHAVGIHSIGVPIYNIVNTDKRSNCEFTAFGLVNGVPINANIIATGKFIPRDIYAPLLPVLFDCSSTFSVPRPLLLFPDLSNRIICVRGDKRIVFVSD